MKTEDSDTRKHSILPQRRQMRSFSDTSDAPLLPSRPSHRCRPHSSKTTTPCCRRRIAMYRRPEELRRPRHRQGIGQPLFLSASCDPVSRQRPSVSIRRHRKGVDGRNVHQSEQLTSSDLSIRIFKSEFGWTLSSWEFQSRFHLLCLLYPSSEYTRRFPLFDVFRRYGLRDMNPI